MILCSFLVFRSCVKWRHRHAVMVYSLSDYISDWYNSDEQNHSRPWQHDDITKWKHFLHQWCFVRGIHGSPLEYPHKGQWRGALMFFFYLHLNKRFRKKIEMPVIWVVMALIMTSLMMRDVSKLALRLLCAPIAHRKFTHSSKSRTSIPALGDFPASHPC